MEWNREKCLQLIDLYEQFPVLWNPKHGLYYNKVKKFDAWREIENILGCVSGEAKKKMDSMLASFRREKAKGKKSIGTGKARHEIYESKWFAFPRMAFLLDRDEPRTTLDSIQREGSDTVESEWEEPQNQDADTHSQEEDIRKISTPTTETETSESSTSLNVTVTPSQTVGRKRKIPHTPENSKVDEALCILKSAVTSKPDGCSVYGQHVANKLRTYTTKTQNIVQYHMNNILFNADMGYYDNETGHSQSTVSPISAYQRSVPPPSQYESTVPSLHSFSASQNYTQYSSQNPQTSVPFTMPSTSKDSYQMSNVDT